MTGLYCGQSWLQSTLSSGTGKRWILDPGYSGHLDLTWGAAEDGIVPTLVMKRLHQPVLIGLTVWLVLIGCVDKQEMAGLLGRKYEMWKCLPCSSVVTSPPHMHSSPSWTFSKLWRSLPPQGMRASSVINWQHIGGNTQEETTHLKLG